MPVKLINEWLAKEQELGSKQPNRIVLATAGRDGIAHSRIVAIREIAEKGVLFFTQRASRKTREIAENPLGSMTLWLPLQQREIVLEGKIEAIPREENEYYWSKRPREMQLRFSAYAPTSGQVLSSLDELEEKYQEILHRSGDKAVPMSEDYCGYWLVADTLVFYTLNDDGFSDVMRYRKVGEDWLIERLSP